MPILNLIVSQRGLSERVIFKSVSCFLRFIFIDFEGPRILSYLWNRDSVTHNNITLRRGGRPPILLTYNKPLLELLPTFSGVATGERPRVGPPRAPLSGGRQMTILNFDARDKLNELF